MSGHALPIVLGKMSEHWNLHFLFRFEFALNEYLFERIS